MGKFHRPAFRARVVSYLLKRMAYGLELLLSRVSSVGNERRERGR